jgi:predicted DNA-binding protein (UPF0251 family)
VTRPTLDSITAEDAASQLLGRLKTLTLDPESLGITRAEAITILTEIELRMPLYVRDAMRDAHKLHGLTLDEVGAAAGVSRQAVWNRLNR